MARLGLLLRQQDDLRDEAGRPIFAKAFPYLQSLWESEQPQALFQDVMDKVFHAGGAGSLHVVHLKGSGGEIGLRVGENDFPSHLALESTNGFVSDAAPSARILPATAAANTASLQD